MKFLCLLGRSWFGLELEGCFLIYSGFQIPQLIHGKTFFFFLVFKTALWVYMLSVGMRQDVKVGSSV